MIRPIRLDSIDFVEFNTKIPPKFGVDLYGWTYIESNLNQITN